MKSVDLTPFYRNSIGFDRLAALINNAMAEDTNTNGYPPYNIEILDDNHYAITLAVAGFDESELDIQVEKGVLTVTGNKTVKEERHYLYHGIANRTFERKFNLADYVEVIGADLTNGLLTIELNREIPEHMRPRTIAIKNNNQALEEQTTEQRIETH